MAINLLAAEIMATSEDGKSLPIFTVLPGPRHLRHCPAHNLITWHPTGVLDDALLADIAEWLCAIENYELLLKRFVDFSRLTSIAIRSRQVCEFALKRAEQFRGRTAVRTALFCPDWLGYGVARLYESLMEGTPIDARAFRDLPAAASWLDVPAEILDLDNQSTAP